MKKLLMTSVVGALFLVGGTAFAEGTTAPTTTTTANEADCKLSDINTALDNAMAAIKASPAYGHAGGHYSKAEKDLMAVKKQLETGCKAWMKGGEKAKAPKPAAK